MNQQDKTNSMYETIGHNDSVNLATFFLGIIYLGVSLIISLQFNFYVALVFFLVAVFGTNRIFNMILRGI